MASDFQGMPLTRAQALAAAGVLVLAYDAAVPAGETIAQGAAAAAAAAGGPKGAPKHVATAKGAQHFHAGIGGLIIPHGMHYVHGQPGHVIHGTSEANWIANQWKDKDKASDAAEKAVAAGTHHWVQAGEHSYAVHNGLEVHIPKDTDVHDEAAVKKAPKVIVKHGDHPEHVMLYGHGTAGEIQPHDAGSQHLLETAYKKLPEQQSKKSVTFEGKHAAWVPHDWQVYKSNTAVKDESHLSGKFAKDALGNWHFIHKNGDIDKGPLGEPEKWAASGSIVPEEKHHGPEPEHVAPNQGVTGPEPAKTDIGGVAVTKDEIHSAIQHLQEDKSTAVKQPLAKKGHPLAAMDYHCADSRTEIFTRRGWLRWDEVRSGDWALALNPETGLAEWSEIESVFDAPYSGLLLEIAARSHSSVTTADHRWLVSGWGDKFVWTTTDQLNTSHRIVLAAPGAAAAEPKYSDELVELAAWFFTEGSFYGFQAQLSQSMRLYREYCVRIERCLRAVADGAWRSTDRPNGVRLYHLRQPLVRFLRELMPAKVPTPEFLTTLTQAQLEMFIKTCIDADGTRQRQHGPTFYQEDLARMGAFTFACALAGQPVAVGGAGMRGTATLLKCSTRRVMNERLGPRGGPQMRGMPRREVWYEGTVWCPKLQHGNWLARRAGTVYFTGNTVAKAELAAHPELKVPAGTKKEHVGQVKIAVLHHLAAQADKMAADEAHAKAAEEAAAKAEAAADHAQKLTPATFDIGGVSATGEQIADAIKDLEASKSTAIKQILKAKGNPLADSDYWQVIKDYEAAHPAVSQHGTKQAHVANAKTKYIAALHEKAGHAAQEDQASGHDAQAQLDQLITGPGSYIKGGWDTSADGAVAAALWQAAKYKQPAYAYLGPNPGLWTTSFLPPVGKASMKATPEHVVTLVLSGGKEDHDFTPDHVLEIAKQWLGTEQAAIAAAEKAAKAAPEGIPSELHSFLANGVAPKGINYKSLPESIADALLKAKEADVNNAPVFVAQVPGHGTDAAHSWVVQFTEPKNAPVYYQVSVMAYKDGWLPSVGKREAGTLGLQMYDVNEIAGFVKAAGKEAGAAKTAKDEAEHQAAVEHAAAAQVAVAEKAQALAEWKASPDYQVIHDLIQNYPGGVPPHDNPLDTGQHLAALLYMAAKQHKTWYLYSADNGDWSAFKSLPSGYAGTYGMPGKPWYTVDENHQITSYDTHSQPTEIPGEYAADLAKKWLVPKQPEPEKPPIPVSVMGEKVGEVPAGSTIYTGAKAINPGTAVKYVKKPDGSWEHWGTNGSNTATYHEVAPAGSTMASSWDEMLANGEFQEVSSEPPKASAKGGAPELISVAGVAFVAGSKVYQYGDGKWPKLIKTPAGSWHKVYADGSAEKANETSFSTYDHMVKIGKIEPASAEPEKPAVGPDILISVDGKQAGTVPAGSQIYIHKDFAGNPQNANKFVKLPDGSWQTFWTDDGQPDSKIYPASEAGQLEAFVQAGTWIPFQLGTKAPEPEKTFMVKAGGTAYQAPAGSKIYVWAEDKAPSFQFTPDQVKYVKAPDGSWKVIQSMGVASLGPTTQDAVTSGKLVPWTGEGAGSVAGEPVTVEAGGAVWKAPAGSKVYVWGEGYQPSDSHLPDKLKYVELPDGTWKSVGVGSAGAKAVPDQSGKVALGHLVPWTPDMGPSEETQTLKKLLTNGAVAPSTSMTEGKAASDWALVTTLQKVAKVGGQRWVYKKSSGAWSTTTYTPADSASLEYYHVTPDLAVTHHLPGGDETAVPPEKVTELVNQLVTPDAVKIFTGGEYKIVKHGFYYKPSKTAKAYLEIGPPPEGSSNSATYTYHAPSGTKTVGATYAGKVLQDATEYYPQPKGTPVTLKVAHATVLKPGTWQSWSDISKAPAKNYIMEVFSDGSMNVGTPGNLYPLPAVAVGEEGYSPLDTLIKGGTILDQYGTSLVKPGVPTEAYHIFGSEAKTPEQVKDLLTQFEHASGLGTYSKLMADTFPEDQTDRALEFFGDKAAADSWQGQRDALLGLLRELLKIPGAPAIASAEPVFLKSLPPGIHSAKDVFTWTDQGYAKPADVTWPAHGLAYETSTVLTELIKQISSQHGDGKVVGTHPSALAKDAKIDWLTAWQAGDMAKIFAYDSSGGKVSLAHPGAPKNDATHHITWAPWDPSQVPASQVVEGNWTAPGVIMPHAEVANYLIKAGLQHGEYLSHGDRRAWVNAHRAHDQLTVDKLSKQAADAFSSGVQPVTEPLTWTDNLQPAKPYDIFFEDKTAAANWTSQATTAFAADHETELLPFAQKLISEQGSSLSPQSWLEQGSYYRQKAIQAYLDDIKAKEYAESLKPVYVLTPGASAPQSSHPIYDLTATVPATGAKSRWYFKPAPASEKFLAEQEDAAARLAHLWGFKTPDSKLIEFDGQYGQAQHRLDAIGDLSYGKPLGFYDQAPIPWNELTPAQVSDIAREHLLDWALDNDDGRASNFLRMPDGSITGIDKGRAWASFGHWKGLSGDHQADERSAQVVTQLYAAIRGHQISQDTADAAYISAIQRARRMQRLPDAQMRAVLEQAFANRTTFGAPGTKEALIQEAIGRKNSLEKDFTDLWQRVYNDAGWQLPEVPEQKLPTLADGTVLHSGFTEPDFIDHVKGSKSYGVPAFFGGTELDGGHFLVWHEYRGKDTSNEVIMGESAARGAALEKLTEWAKAHAAASGGGYESQFGDVGGVKGEKDLYDKIIAAAKTVSHHAADKAFNQDKMNGLAEAKTTLEQRLSFAENQLAQGGHEAQWVKMYGDPHANIDMAKHYLDLVDRVEKAKDTGGTFSAGALPRWEPEKAPADDQPEIKVQAVSPQRHMTIGWQKDYVDTALNPDTGELHTNNAPYSGGEGGTVWQVTLPTGELIEIGDSDYTGVPLAQHGRIRFQAVAEDGAASLERIRAQLQAMGLSMNDASEQDLELFYWRHLAHILADRADSTAGKHAQVWDELKARATMAKMEWNSSDKRGSIDSLASLSPDEELAIWHAAWSKLTSEDQVTKWVNGGGHLPHLKHFDYRDPSKAGGKPDWYRFDITPEMMSKWQMPAHAFQSDSSEDPARVVFSGGLFSKEARIRALGLKVSGMDNPASSGATGFVFTRLNQEHGSGWSVYLTPKILARTTNYGWDSDLYGKLHYRKSSAYFDPEKAAAWQSGGNETMVADALSLLDDVEILRAYNEEQRQMLIHELEQAGIDIIRGIPVSKRIVTKVGPDLIAEIRATYAEHPELLDPLEVAGVA